MFTGQNTSMSIKEDFQKLMEIKDKKIAELENELSNEEKQADELVNNIFIYKNLKLLKYILNVLCFLEIKIYIKIKKIKR